MNLLRSKKLQLLLAVGTGIVLPCFFYIVYFSVKPQSSTPKAVVISNQSLPKSNLYEIKTKKDYSNTITKGKVLLIFLSSKCHACNKDIELISKIYTRLSSEIHIYGISVDTPATTIKFIDENQIPFPILVDENNELFKKLQVNLFPTKYLINDGTIKKTLFGNFANEKKLFEDIKIGNN